MGKDIRSWWTYPVVRDGYRATGCPPASHNGCGVANADSSSCRNPGRWLVGDVWCCTNHYKTLTRRGLA